MLAAPCYSWRLFTNCKEWGVGGVQGESLTVTECHEWEQRTMQPLTKTHCTLLGDLEDFYAEQDLSPRRSFRTKKPFNNISIAKTPNRLQSTRKPNRFRRQQIQDSNLSFHFTWLRYTEIYLSLGAGGGERGEAERNPGHSLLRTSFNFFK